MNGFYIAWFPRPLVRLPGKFYFTVSTAHFLRVIYMMRRPGSINGRWNTAGPQSSAQLKILTCFGFLVYAVPITKSYRLFSTRFAACSEVAADTAKRWCRFCLRAMASTLEERMASRSMIKFGRSTSFCCLFLIPCIGVARWRHISIGRLCRIIWRPW